MKNEIKNQIVHYTIAMHISIIFWFMGFHYLIVYFSVLLLAVIIELLQYFFVDKRELKLYDRLMDIAFYVIGARIGWLIMEFTR